MTEKTDIEIIESNWLNWCRLCAKDDVCGNVKVYTGENASTWNGVLIKAIEKYFNVHMRLEDDLSSVLCNECYTLVSELIDFDKHVNKVQALFETLRSSEPGKKLDVESLRRQYGLQEDDWTHIIKPVTEFDNNVSMQSDGPEIKPELVDICGCLEIVQLGNSEESDVNQLPLKEISISGKKTLNDSQNSLRKQTVKITDGDKNEEDASASLEESEAHSSGSEGENDLDFEKLGKRRTLKCRHCAKVYHNPRSLKKHLEIDCRNTWLRCKMCDQKFPTASVLKAHRKDKHSNDRPYGCDICGNRFKTSSVLNTHKLVHTDARPFECSFCPATFKNESRLKGHLQYHEEPRFECIICGKMMKTRDSWKKHQLVHSNMCKYECEVCHTKFKRHDAHKRHVLNARCRF